MCEFLICVLFAVGFVFASWQLYSSDFFRFDFKDVSVVALHRLSFVGSFVHSFIHSVCLSFFYYVALLPRRGPHYASHSVCPSVCLSVCLSVRPVIVTERHVAPPSELQWHTCTFRHALRAAYRTAISAAQILVHIILYCVSLCWLWWTKVLDQIEQKFYSTTGACHNHYWLCSFWFSEW